MEKKDTIVQAEREIRCAGKCEGECKCTLFRLEVGRIGGPKFDPKSAKWEYVAKADKWVPFLDGYLYLVLLEVMQRWQRLGCFLLALGMLRASFL